MAEVLGNKSNTYPSSPMPSRDISQAVKLSKGRCVWRNDCSPTATIVCSPANPAGRGLQPSPTERQMLMENTMGRVL